MLQKTTLKKQAYEYIKNAINNDRYPTDVVYSEQSFATELGISRTPIREAILQLKQEGYVNIHPNRGITIKKLTIEETEEIYQARAAIEGYCWMYAAERIDSPEGAKLLQTLTELNKQESDIHRNGADAVRYMQTDSEFHMAIIAFTKNKTLEDIITNLRSRINLVGIKSLSHEERMPASIKEHERLIHAMREGDRLAVVQHLECHLLAPMLVIKQMQAEE